MNPRLTPVAMLVAALLLPSGALQAATVSADTDNIDDIIVVTGSRTEESLDDVAGAVSVLSRQRVSEQLSTDLSTLFRFDPSVSSTGVAGAPQTLSVRGIGGNRLIYIKDGRRLNDGYAGGGGYLIGRGYLSTQQLQRVELAKAAASPLYGSDGLGGILVMTSIDPDDLLQHDDRYLALNVGYQSVAEQAYAGVTAATQQGQHSLLLDLNHRRGHETQNYPETLPGFDFDNSSLLAKWQYQLSAQQQFKLTLDHYQLSNQQTLTSGTNETDDKDRSTALSLDYQSSITSLWYDAWQGQLYYSNYKQESDQIRPGNGAEGAYIDLNDYDFEQDIWGLRWQASKRLTNNNSEHRLVYGLDVDWYDTDRPRYKTRQLNDGTPLFSNQPQAAFPGAETLLSGVFVQDNITFKDSAWQLIAGFRVDHMEMSANDNPLYDMTQLRDMNETAFSPKLGAIYALSDNTNIYLQYARGFKIPPHDQAYQSHGVEPFYQILPNPELEPETSDAIELGVKFANGQTRVHVAAFYSKFDDFIDTEVVALTPSPIPGVDRISYQYVNRDEADIYGLEINASHWFSDHWQGRFSAAYTRGKDNTSDRELASINPLQAVTALRYNGDNWYSEWLLTATDGMTRLPSDNALASSGWATLDWLVGANWQHWQVQAGVFNILDREYVPYGTIAGLSEGTSTEQYSQPGRSLGAQLSYRF
ncbi:TonB-dependent receptor domain-containing protein [Idiomarina xiamenensis]|uniref:Uncharacterized protein n=1 Tax=Idiomarina xiamenensis 10-D-4 TaxID=740709 RepID=K2KIH4_9GAMM|nr:TonB-dependent receptor [Idiomarina xiamenensis]EKE87663.1 hypothetical protein A10D4_01175 [Idiomarina xiamenensis 10-D-4]